MKLNLIFYLALFLLFGCTTRKNVERSKTEKKTVEYVTVRDTIYKERIVEKKIIVRDTVEKKSQNFNILGKPTYDSVSKTWRPFEFDYTVFNGQDSTRYKGSFSGETNFSSENNWERMYKELLSENSEKETEQSANSTEIVKSEEFKEKKESIQKEGFPLEMILYGLGGTALFFYFLGLFTPKIWKWIKTTNPQLKILNFFKKRK